MTNLFLIPMFICSFIRVFIPLKANICRDVLHQAALLRWQSGRSLVLWPAMCQVQVSLCWQKHQKFREMGSCFLFMSYGVLNYKGVFVQLSFFIQVLLWNFARSVFMMVLQKNWMLWKRGWSCPFSSLGAWAVFFLFASLVLSWWTSGEMGM